MASLANPIVVTAVVFLTLLAPPAAKSQAYLCDTVITGQSELVTFSSMNGEDHLVEVKGSLRKPSGEGKFSALILLHGQGGVMPPRCLKGAIDLFTSWKYVTLLVDSESQTDLAGTKLTNHTSTDQAQHALAAAQYLASLPYVEGSQIGVVGWSTGGLSAIKIIAGTVHGNGVSVIAAAGIYPICPRNTRWLDGPLLILIGDKDTVTPASSCKNLEEMVLSDNIELVIYPGAGHGFDAPDWVTYQPTAARDAYERIQRFFDKQLRARN